MRKKFFQLLYEQMLVNQDVTFITGDLGFSLIEPIRDRFSDRFFNFQAAEFVMTGAGIGMALTGKIPIVYSITPFVIFRPMELLRTYVDYENIPIKIVGAGRNKDYEKEGISHWAHDVRGFLDQMPNIQQFYPENEVDLVDLLPEFLYNKKPGFLSLKK